MCSDCQSAAMRSLLANSKARPEQTTRQAGIKSKLVSSPSRPRFVAILAFIPSQCACLQVKAGDARSEAQTLWERRMPEG